ncbi:MAG: potassium transporter TrkG [Castellaniella sp.]
MPSPLPHPLRSAALRASPPLILAAGFLALIALGTVLLALPIAAPTRLDPFHALFMATSAVTVTGLSVINPAHELTTFGQVVLIGLVQLGGLGFVTFAVLTALAMGRKLSLRQQALALQAFNQTNVARIQRTAATVIRISLVVELSAALVLTLWWWREMPFGSALGYGLFHAIAAFNNAGFSLFENSLTDFAADAVVLLTISALIILGGIGFSVLHNTWHKKGRWAHLTPYARIILLGTLILNLTGFALLWLLEYSNDDTLGALSLQGQALSAWLQSVTARTAGFTSIDITLLRDSSTIVLMVLMFIGGGSLSTASGIKIGTFIILLAVVRSYLVQSRDVVLMKRSIEPETIHKSLALVFVTMVFALVGVFLLTVFEDRPFIDLLFEAISALSTTGMSRDLTPVLSLPSKAILITMMFAGRLGPLTLIYTLATRQHSRVRYPVAEFPVG